MYTYIYMYIYIQISGEGYYNYGDLYIHIYTVPKQMP